MMIEAMSLKHIIEALAHYSWQAFPFVMGIGLVSSLVRWDMALLRCVTIIVAGQLLTNWWVAGGIDRQPAAFLFVLYFVSAIAATVRPSGKLCSTLAGVCIAGVSIFGLSLAMKYTPERDYAFWQANVLIGVMVLLVVLGGSTGERGRRACVAVGRWCVRLVKPSLAGRLA